MTAKIIALRITMVFAILAILQSCTSSLKNLTYMHDVKINWLYPNVPLPESYKIRPNDYLFINVIGEDQQSTDFLNMNSVTSGNSLGMDMFAYLVDEKGNISYPQLGEINVEGKTVLEVRDILQKMVNQYIENTSVQVKLVNRTFTALGDVSSQGLHPMIKNQLTIFEALGVVGGVTDYGNRRKVKLIRETPLGKKVVDIDLTDASLLASDYFYIQPNDVLYVEPNRFRVYNVKTVPWIGQVSLGVSLLTTALLILNLFK